MMRRLINALPPPISLSLVKFKRLVFPSPTYRGFRKLCQKIGDPKAILHGPFAGMRYVSDAHGSAFLPKIVGSYEMELHPAIESLCQASFDVLVDVGVAEGYYAVGFARRLPQIRVIGFDISPRARYLCRKLAVMNGVASRISIRPAGGPAEINEAIASARNPLVICDCEGAEDQLLLPGKMPHLHRATVLVEMHDGLCPGVSDRTRDRFEASHKIIHIPARECVPADLHESFQPLSEAEKIELVSEGRVHQQHWFIMSPLSQSQQGNVSGHPAQP